MDLQELKRTARTKAILSSLFIVGIVFAEVVGVMLVLLLDIPDTSMWTSIVIELFAGAVAMCGVAALGGRSLIGTSREDVGFTFRFGWFCIALSVVLMFLDLSFYLSDGTPISTNWMRNLGELALLCLVIGIFEEFLFRGIIFNGLLAVMGSTHKGVVRAVFLTSFFFGCAHVNFTSDFVDALSVVQAVLKVVQTGMYSILLCVIMLRTRRLVGVSLYHGLDDFVLLFPSVVLFDEEVTTEYVVQGEDALPTIAYYLVIIALYLPFTIKALRELRRGQDRTRGAFMQDAVRSYEQAQLQAMGYSTVPFGAGPTDAVPAQALPALPPAPVMPSSWMGQPVAQPQPQSQAQGQPWTWVDQQPVQPQVPAQAIPQTSLVPEAWAGQPIVQPQPKAPVISADAGGQLPYQRNSGRPPAPQGW